MRPMILLVAALLAAPASAQALKPFTDCAAIVEDAARLACYDRAVAAVSPALRAEVEAREKEAAARAAAAAAAAEAKAAEQAKASFGRETMRDPPPSAEARADSLEARVTEVFTDASRKLVILLDNGQMWRQSGTAFAVPPKPGAEVILKRGSMGSVRMLVPARNDVIWVVRVR